MSLTQTSLEDAYGGKPFGSRAPIHISDSTPPQTREGFKPSEEAQRAVARTLPSLPIVETPPPVQEGFKLRVESPAPVETRMAVRERFSTPPPARMDEDKLARILRLIEQNRTGYERPAVQDMLLYVFTGVFFLFTFDTFVLLGKSMRPRKG